MIIVNPFIIKTHPASTAAALPIFVTALLFFIAPARGNGRKNTDEPIKNRAKLANTSFVLMALPIKLMMGGQILTAERNPATNDIMLI